MRVGVRVRVDLEGVGRVGRRLCRASAPKVRVGEARHAWVRGRARGRVRGRDFLLKVVTVQLDMVR